MALKQPSFAIVNDVANIASQLPRAPDEELIMLLQRPGATSTYKKTFRPYKIKQALRWLVAHNPLYYDMWDAGKIDYNLTGISAEKAEEVPITVNLTSEEEAAMLATVGNSNSTIDSDQSEMSLLDIPPEVTSKELDASLKLNVKAKFADTQDPLPLPEKGDYVAPWQDPVEFDAKAFPQHFPYGSGGLPGEAHGLKDMELVRLHLKRGGDRRFQRSMPYIFEKFTRQTRKTAGGVALIASKSMEPQGDGGGGAVLGNPISELNACTDAEEILATLEKDNGFLLKKLMKRIEPFSRGLSGSPLHIAYERKQLLAMLTSTIVTSSGMLSIFGTNSPCDRFNPELYDIVKPGMDGGRKLSSVERAEILRTHPALAARIFDARVTALFKNIYGGTAQPFGAITDSWIRVEFQGTGLAFPKLFGSHTAAV